jgi:thiamine biosynthesis lipoprotein
MTSQLTRRRAIAIVGAAIHFAALRWTRAAAAEPVRWRGQVLGAEAHITLYHPDRAAAVELIADCVGEVDRLERQFSLYRPDSVLCRLNRTGRIERPPPEFRRLMREALRFSALTGGAFDATVQPLWALYAAHFAAPDADPDGPSAAAIAAACAKVGWRRIRIDDESITLAAPGMAVTLDGIAQGFITDAVADQLRARGVAHVLLDLGEMRALGPRADGTPWRVGIANPRRPAEVLEHLDLRDAALATSGGYGTVFERTGRFHHLFVPAKGTCAHSWASVSVTAATATVADGLSTAIAVAPRDQAEALLRAGGGSAALLVDDEGSIRRIENAGARQG